jgi:hypothetical protein
VPKEPTYNDTACERRPIEDPIFNREYIYIYSEPYNKGELPMKKSVLVVSLLVSFFGPARAQEDEVAEVAAASCSLSVKTTVLPSDSTDGTGKVKIEAFLFDNNGAPIPAVEIRVSANCGTFSCKPPANEIDADTGSSEAGFCYNTKNDGSIRVYLINIPFNKPGKIIATCSVGNFAPRASSTFIIRRSVIRGKAGNKMKKT